MIRPGSEPEIDFGRVEVAEVNIYVNYGRCNLRAIGERALRPSCVGSLSRNRRAGVSPSVSAELRSP